jgi:endonuclease IV
MITCSETLKDLNKTYQVTITSEDFCHFWEIQGVLFDMKESCVKVKREAEYQVSFEKTLYYVFGDDNFPY